MNLKQIRSIVRNSPNVDWFDNQAVVIRFPHIEYSQQLTGITGAFAFVERQVVGWDAITRSLPAELQKSRSFFTRVKSQMSEFIINFASVPLDQLDQNWAPLRKRLNDPQEKPLLFDLPVVDFLLSVHEEKPDYFQGAYSFVMHENRQFGTEFVGVMLGYEFVMKEGALRQRGSNNIPSFASIRNDVEMYLADAEIQIKDVITSATSNVSKEIVKIDSVRQKSESLFKRWFEKTRTEEWGTWFANVSSQVAELESTYEEKLRLQAPAAYWEIRGKALQKQGWIYFGFLIGLVFVAIMILSLILTKTPDVMFQSWFQDDKTGAIRWTIAFVGLMTFLGYGIRLLAKAMFSSFHLARDSQERHTLTYFYLALLKDSNIESSQKQLIMQALFSRAETGLLKEESTPAIPGEMGKLRQ